MVELHDRLTTSATGTAHLLIPRAKRSPHDLTAGTDEASSRRRRGRTAAPESAQDAVPRDEAAVTSLSAAVLPSEGESARVSIVVGGVPSVAAPDHVAALQTGGGSARGSIVEGVTTSIPAADRAAALQTGGGSARGSIVAGVVTRTRNSSRRLSNVLADVKMASVSAAAVATHHIEELLDFNLLETALLSSSTSVLISGMIFESSMMPVGSPGYVVLEVFVGGVFTVSLGLFIWMLALETRRSCVQKRLSADLSKVVDPTKATMNPMRRMQTAAKRALGSIYQTPDAISRALVRRMTLSTQGDGAMSPPPSTAVAMLQRFKSARFLQKEERRASLAQGGSLTSKPRRGRGGEAPAASGSGGVGDATATERTRPSEVMGSGKGITGGAGHFFGGASTWAGSLTRRKTVGSLADQRDPVHHVKPVVTAGRTAFGMSSLIGSVGAMAVHKKLRELPAASCDSGAAPPGLGVPSGISSDSGPTVCVGTATIQNGCPSDEMSVQVTVGVGAPTAPDIQTGAARARTISMMERVRRLQSSASGATDVPKKRDDV